MCNFSFLGVWRAIYEPRLGGLMQSNRHKAVTLQEISLFHSYSRVYTKPSSYLKSSTTESIRLCGIH
jgi:hypothetical protein